MSPDGYAPGKAPPSAAGRPVQPGPSPARARTRPSRPAASSAPARTPRAAGGPPVMPQPVQRHPVQPRPRPGEGPVIGPPGLEGRHPHIAEQVLGRLTPRSPREVSPDRNLVAADHLHKALPVAGQRSTDQF